MKGKRIRLGERPQVVVAPVQSRPQEELLAVDEKQGCIQEDSSTGTVHWASRNPTDLAWHNPGVKVSREFRMSHR